MGYKVMYCSNKKEGKTLVIHFNMTWKTIDLLFLKKYHQVKKSLKSIHIKSH